jgi:hypothetical protein
MESPELADQLRRPKSVTYRTRMSKTPEKGKKTQPQAEHRQRDQRRENETANKPRAATSRPKSFHSQLKLRRATRVAKSELWENPNNQCARGRRGLAKIPPARTSRAGQSGRRGRAGGGERPDEASPPPGVWQSRSPGSWLLASTAVRHLMWRGGLEREERGRKSGGQRKMHADTRAPARRLRGGISHPNNLIGGNPGRR